MSVSRHSPSFWRKGNEESAVKDLSVDDLAKFSELELMSGVKFHLGFLQDIRGHDDATLEALEFGYIVVDRAHAMFHKAANGSLREKLAAMGSFVEQKEQHMKDVASFVDRFSKVKVVSGAVSAWRRLHNWMRALHDHTAKHLRNESGVVPKHSDGSYPTLDWVDYGFKKRTGGVSKYSLIAPFGEAADSIRDAIQAIEAKSISSPKATL